MLQNPEARTDRRRSRSRAVWLVVAGIIYLLSGIFIVPANEKAVVRRFGRPILPARASGLHFDLPWPFCKADRVNFNEVRTLTLGEIDTDPNFLQPTLAARPSTFLTGDKNLLSLRLSIQYRILEEDVIDWLYGSQNPVERLQSLVESTATELVSRSGVDFVHTQGLAELNNRLLQKVREQASQMHLGCAIEQVTVDRAEPPIRVKSEFLDVSNARADMARSIHEARSYSEQSVAESQADARRLVDNAERERQTRISSAKGSADRFRQLVAQIRQDTSTGERSYVESRQLVMNRLFLDTIRDAIDKSKLKVVLDGDRPFDLTVPK